MPKKSTKLDPILIARFEAHGLPLPAVEYRFDSSRRWRFDWCWPDRRIALEVEGGIWSGGRHTRGSGFLADIDKYNSATLAGWRLLRTTWPDVESGKAFALLERAFAE